MKVESDAETSKGPSAELPDFSLVLGGPLYQIYRRTHLSGDTLNLPRRRVLTITMFVWLPLLVLSILDGHARGGGVKIPFLYDVEANVRFLIVLPILIASEVVAHKRISPLVRRFVERRIIGTENLPAFDSAVRLALRTRNSVAVELAILVLVYTVGLWVWRNQIAAGAPTWYAGPEGLHLHLTLAGYWYAFVSIPFFQFILLRWYMRLGVWFRLLWQVSRLNLHLSAAHPDRAGGIGFLGQSSYAFSPILFAQGAMLSGLIANQILYEGRSLLSFKMEAAGFIGFFVLFILGPLGVFAPQLSHAKSTGAAEYGLLANLYVFGFEDKWVRGATSGDSVAIGELLGTADIQSLADLGNSYSAVREMRIVPFGLEDITRLALATAAPLLPLMLTIFSLEELVLKLIRFIF